MMKQEELYAQPVIRLTDISFQYDSQTRVLEKVTLTLHRGDYLGLVGPNGSGKSTLIKVILGLLQPTAGQAELFGQPVASFRNWSKVGYVSQKASIFNSGFPATVYEVVASGLFGKMGLFRWLGRREKDEIRQALQLVGLEAVSSRNIGQLSGGQQQRAFIARALVSRPELLILDEPTVGVDAETVSRFFDLLTRLNRELGITLLLVSHDIGLISQKVKQMACLNRKLIFHGDPGQFAQNREAILAVAYGHHVCDGTC